MIKAADKHVGDKIRNARKLAKLTQTQLGEKLGISFQQVQKYEKGTNRVGSSRLWDISEILDIPVAAFFEGLPGQGADSGSLDSYSIVALRNAERFDLIKSDKMREAISNTIHAADKWEPK